MNAASEIPLLAFTLLAQMAVGIVLVGQLAVAGFTDGQVRTRLQNQSFFALLFVAVAALLSFFHLGTPLHGPFTLSNIGSSWLSREIAMVIATGAGLAALAYMRWKKPESSANNPLALLVCALGLIFIYAMSKVYSSPFLPGWAGSSTFFLFFASTLILGSLWLACSLGTAKLSEGPAYNSAFWRIFFFAVAGFVLLAICQPMAGAESVGGLNPLSRESSLETISLLQGWHACLSGLAIMLFCAALWQMVRKRPMAGILIAALCVAIAGEVLGRLAFYMSYARIGM